MHNMSLWYYPHSVPTVTLILTVTVNFSLKYDVDSFPVCVENTGDTVPYTDRKKSQDFHTEICL